MTPASDIYSLGVVAYEMLAGVPPFNDSDMWVLIQKMQTETPRPLSSCRIDVPNTLEAVIDRMMARDLRHRYGAVSDVIRDLSKTDC